MFGKYYWLPFGNIFPQFQVLMSPKRPMSWLVGPCMYVCSLNQAATWIQTFFSCLEVFHTTPSHLKYKQGTLEVNLLRRLLRRSMNEWGICIQETDTKKSSPTTSQFFITLITLPLQILKLLVWVSKDSVCPVWQYIFSVTFY